MPAFTPGTPKPPASGRKKGTVNKNTELLRNGVKSAIEIVREGGMHPVEILMEMSRFLRTVGVALAPKGGDAAALQAAVLEMAKTEGGRKQLETMRRFMETASSIACKAAEFSCAKPAPIDYVGDAPARPLIEKKMIFTLNLDSQAGRPVVEDATDVDVDTTEDED